MGQRGPRCGCEAHEGPADAGLRRRDRARRRVDLGARFGTIGWWIETYLRTEAYTNLSVRSRADYREALEKPASLSPAAVDKLYAMLRAGGVVRQANYPIDVARRAWKVVSRKYLRSSRSPIPTIRERGFRSILL